MSAPETRSGTQRDVTTLLLIRHGHHHLLGKVLAGRQPGLHLSAAGAEQMRCLAGELRQMPVAAVFCGPLERVRESASAIAAPFKLAVESCRALDEIDFGQWSGQSFAQLESDPHWQLWNSQRSRTRAPGGESMLEVQDRIAGEILRLRERYRGRVIALVSHGDVIKAALMRFLQIPLDDCCQLEVAPATVNKLEFIEAVSR